jgi:hypothetical protein
MCSDTTPEVNMHDSEIIVEGVLGKIDRWVVEFMAPSGVYPNLSDIPDDERWVAIPVPVAYSGEMKVICVNGNYEEQVVVDLGVDPEGNQLSGGAERDSWHSPVYTGGE